ncbi:hypothetical protein [Niveispirillum cyanobacteriorum]|uniref:Uncharacterized protein n=1 Tax=Niveispirillum cyanobacteriorum TaxID=1612173 RepID=A0A2K9NJY5_9PROT|nr:hypothetical protein [Niveispirillum cyanobacteriorum]AUN33341.1 hypothetical protein C0V82_23520 [Niveispirillum cyanobacteriorum]GGE49533.1 hypothetical protein GCM10011317_04880 [Niveispirillum cyanobacteriorum]
MSDTYVTLKIREALKAAQGSRSQAQRVLIAWALDDEQLLRGLCKPFLKAIAGSAVDRVARGGSITTAAPAPGQGVVRAARPSTGPKKLSPQMMDAIIARMGTGGGGTAPPPDDGQEQADNLKALAAAFTQRKKP